MYINFLGGGGDIFLTFLTGPPWWKQWPLETRSLGLKIEGLWDFPGGSVVKNLLANAGSKGSLLGLGRSHMPQSN